MNVRTCGARDGSSATRTISRCISPPNVSESPGAVVAATISGCIRSIDPIPERKASQMSGDGHARISSAATPDGFEPSARPASAAITRYTLFVDTRTIRLVDGITRASRDSNGCSSTIRDATSNTRPAWLRSLATEKISADSSPSANSKYSIIPARSCDLPFLRAISI